MQLWQRIQKWLIWHFGRQFWTQTGLYDISVFNQNQNIFRLAEPIELKFWQRLLNDKKINIM